MAVEVLPPLVDWNWTVIDEYASRRGTTFRTGDAPVVVLDVVELQVKVPDVTVVDELLELVPLVVLEGVLVLLEEEVLLAADELEEVVVVL